MKILIADPDENLLNMLSLNLKEHGFRVITVRDAVQTWVSVLREVPDAVLMDVNMPGGGGFSVLRSMKHSAKTSHIPVFLMSGREGREQEEQARTAGAEMLLGKPVNLVQFVKMMERIAAGESPTGEAKSLPAGVTPLAPAAGMKMLVADDDPGTRHMLKGMLGKWGYEVLLAANGSEARRMLEARDAPALAILDWEMPGAKGVELIREARRLEKDTYTYFIVLTAKSFKNDMLEALSSGADDYMVKPFDAEELRLRVATGRRIVELQEELLEAKRARKAPQLITA